MESRALVLDDNLAARRLQALGRFYQLGVAEHVVFLLLARDLGLVYVDNRATGALVVPLLVGRQVRAAHILNREHRLGALCSCRTLLIRNDAIALRIKD